MTYLKADITDITFDFFLAHKNYLTDVKKINRFIKNVCGINSFFHSQKESCEFLEELQLTNAISIEPIRREYGDFQTNIKLASSVVDYASTKSKEIEFVLEPTCGEGSFILAALKGYKSLKKIVGIEIYKPYVWKTKFLILAHFLENPGSIKPEIDIIHGNAFDFNFTKLASTSLNLKTLIIGNPPWVTNAELGSISSRNLPTKSNFKKHRGFDAITGKGNFDIGEFILLELLKDFQNHNGLIALLIKNSVVKNVLEDQKRNNFTIGNSEKLNIDAKKEFKASVNACLFLTRLNDNPDYTCKEIDFYSKSFITEFGWYKDKFVYSTEDYDKTSFIDGKSKFVWRSGVKHDCSKVMEFESNNGSFTNGLGEQINLENELVYGLLKSSDLKHTINNSFRKHTIITQSKIGEQTDYIKETYPLTYKYLASHKEYFDRRKSSIYRNKPEFSIFGIGNYSFAKFKIAISGLYKTTHFTLVSPNKSKTVMVDDTCYFIGFDSLIMAQIAHYLVNSDLVQSFLRSIIFSDSKRSVNKDILMRIDFGKIVAHYNFSEVQNNIKGVRKREWEQFKKLVL